ncbi:hypothetical protein CLOP_g10515 [Closterium sp. NIES-67]|nr:hypothetical protein CLOP_g10515 [Closterium sp. NIES-67]
MSVPHHVVRCQHYHVTTTVHNAVKAMGGAARALAFLADPCTPEPMIGTQSHHSLSPHTLPLQPSVPHEAAAEDGSDNDGPLAGYILREQGRGEGDPPISPSPFLPHTLLARQYSGGRSEPPIRDGRRQNRSRGPA